MTSTEAERATRVEKDSMGEMEVPADARYGPSTRRAELNFPISNLRFGRSFIKALGQIKQSAAVVNKDLGELGPERADPIIEASQKVIDGDYDSEFVVDIFQTGSGTSTNMNANEVISNLANEAIGEPRGSEESIHPYDHVNMGQSSNDVIPTAIHLAAAMAIKYDLLPEMKKLEDALNVRSQMFWEIVKTGRTHLQDATPIRLGQEFKGYAGQLEYGRKRVELALEEMSELALGGTAVGTGIDMHAEFASRVIARLSELNGLDLKETGNHFQAQSTIDGVVQASGAMKTIAVSLMKIANDIRWLGSGPRAGIGEITIPAVQPGSSIMPGKVNPVIAESLTMVCAQVIGNDTTVTIAGQSGNFELNVMLPVAAHNLLESIDLLAKSCKNFREKCVEGPDDGIQATEKGPDMVMEGLSIGTALNPLIGYDNVAKLVKHAHENNLTVREAALEMASKFGLTEAQIDETLKPLKMTEPESGD